MTLPIETLAQAVVDSWESGDLATAVRNLDAQLQKLKAQREKYAPQIQEAMSTLTTAGEVEIDDEPLLSVDEDGGTGVWVQGWIWVEMQHAGEEEEGGPDAD